LEAVEAGRFHIYPVRTIDEGIEILTGVEAGLRAEGGAFPEGTVHYLANERLKEMAEKLKAYEFGAAHTAGEAASGQEAAEAVGKD
jgi:predicted ATP-dependent protease